MAAQATRQRKGAGAGPPKSGEALVQVSNAIAAQQDFVIASNTASTAGSPRAPIVATVKRNKYGTGPFDENWLNMDCCGLVCASITYMLHLYGVYATCLILIPPWMSTVSEDGIRTISPMGHLNRTAFTLVAVLAVYAHFKAMTTDPGAVPPDAQPIPEIDATMDNNRDGDLEVAGEQSPDFLRDDPLKPIPPSKKKGKRLCRRCNAFKPKRAHHCSICRRCIIKMDHHCPWVNNCVGIGNHKYFLLFVFYTCLSCVYSLTLIGVRFFDCMHHHGHIRTHHMTCLDRPSQLLSILGLFIEAILFGLFTTCMMIDQAGVVTTKMTHIDRLKGGDDALGSSLAGVVEVFGLNPKKLDFADKFRADWLSPFHRICFPSSLHDEIMGFCRPCRSGSNRSNTPLHSETEMTPMIRSVAEIV
ncbi:DHHC palmitoyltransferase [Nitzschia inconspicua]|uniref:Palmitoyltransferase n=1 Tax=Nitzschia inconspicua TaxID=303405 RepID=A0A9K3LJL7_9STRA|nr:DHHC palmitoyltransferase [Nitzschia inconspicua]